MNLHRKLAVLMLLWITSFNVSQGQADNPQTSLGRGPNQVLAREWAELQGLIPGIESYNIVLITVDGLRPGALGYLGNPRANVSPFIDELASRSYRFSHVFAPSADRVTALHSLLYSMHPSTLAEIPDLSLMPSIGTQLADRGFRTAGFCHSSLFINETARLGTIDPKMGFRRRLSTGLSPTGAEKSAQRTLGFRRDEQVFLWFHLPYPWAPSKYHPGYNYGTSDAEHYDAAISCVDFAVRLLSQAIDTYELAPRTVFVIAGSLGLDEKGNTDGLSTARLDDGALRVPLLIHVPGLPGGLVEQPVETTDIVPTLLSLIGKTPDYSVQGRSLLGLFLPESSRQPRWRSVGAFSEFIPAIGAGPEQKTIQSIRKGQWRLTYEPSSRETHLYDTQNPQSGDVAADHGDVVRDLVLAAEETTIYGVACLDSWNRGELRAPDLVSAEGTLARAKWFARNRNPKSREIAAELLASNEENVLLGAMEVLLDVGTDKEMAQVTGLLDHEDYRISALAGAFLLQHGKVDAGLDYALQGLRPEMSATHLVTILEILSGTKSARALDAIRKFSLPDDNIRIDAARTLTMALLGDETGISQLHRFVLEPMAPYSKTPFVDALVNLQPQKALQILRLCLTDGDEVADSTLAILEAVGRIGSRRDADAVAHVVGHEDMRVRRAATKLLSKWHSPAGYSQWIRLARGSENETLEGVSGLLSIDGITGSRLLPGVRFDQVAATNPGSGTRMSRGLPRLDSPGFTFTANVQNTSIETCAIRFRFPGGTTNINTDEIVVRIWINDNFTRTRQIHVDGSNVLWIGTVRARSMEKGVNEIRVAISAGEKTPVMEGVDFVMIPNKVPEGIRPQGGVRTAGEAGNPGIVAAAPVRLERDAEVHRISYVAGGQLGPAGETTLVRLVDGSKTLAELSLPATGGFGDQKLELPKNAWRAQDLKLVVIHRNAESPQQVVTAFLYGVHKSDATR